MEPVENAQNGSSPYTDHYVDRVEQTIQAPTGRHYTKAELLASTSRSSQVTYTSESIETSSTFKETAYLHGLQNNGSKPEEAPAASQSEPSQGLDLLSGLSVDVTGGPRSETNREQPEMAGSTRGEFPEKYVDRTEQVLDDEHESGLISPTITVTKETKLSMMKIKQTSVEQLRSDLKQTNLDSNDHTETGAISSDDGYFFSETEVQPFMEVDPNDIIGYNDDKTDKSPVLDDFLMMRQKRETFSQDERSSQFEQVLEDQLNAQREKERREQTMMDKLLGTIPAYRADWEQKTSVGPEGDEINISATTNVPVTSSDTVSCSSSRLFETANLRRDAGAYAATELKTSDHSETFFSQEQQQSAFLTEVSQTAGSHQQTVWNSTDQSERSEIRVQEFAENLNAERKEDSESMESMSIKEMEEAVLSRGSVMEPSNIIEIERKFILTDNSETKLKDLGGVLISEKSFKDTYYDTLSYKLTLNDLWLRQRGSQWQLKAPVADRVPETSSTQYHELTDEREIVEVLSSLLGLDWSMSLVSLTELVHIGLLSEFCSYTTTRKSYGLKSCTVDLDLTSFGFRVGEIEMVVVDRSRIPEALTAIDEVAALLELQPYASADLTKAQCC